MDDMDSTHKPIYEPERFINPNGGYRTRDMFHGLPTSSLNDDILYTLDARDRKVSTKGGADKGLPSLKRLYLEMEDVTEYMFATTYLHSYEHFCRLMETQWFQEAVTVWRAELKLKIMAKAMKALQMEAEGATPQSFQANKFLATAGWEKMIKNIGITPETPQLAATRGRPKNADIDRRVEELAKKELRIAQDFERIFNNTSEVSTDLPVRLKN